MVNRAFIEHLARGERLQREGNLAKATEELLAAVRLRPDHVGALFELGRLSLMQWRNEEAEHYLSLAVQGAPGHLEAHRLLGIACIQVRDWRRAEKHLQRAIELSKEEHSEDWAMLAMVSASQKKLNQAYRRCQRALALDATSPLAHMVRGRILAQEGDHQAAETALREATSYEPKLGYLHYVLGQIYAAKGDVEAARSEYLTAAQLPDIPPAMVYEALLTHTDDPEEQMLYLEQIMATRPTDVTSRKELIRLYLKAHRLEAVPNELQTLNSVLEGQEDTEVLLLRGDYYALQGELESALATYRRAASLMPNHPDPLYRLGEVLSLLENDQEAIDYFRKAMELRRWADVDYSYEPLLKTEGIGRNRDVARGDGFGPFDLLWAMIYAMFYSARKSLRGWGPVARRHLPYSLIALAFSILSVFWMSMSERVFPAELSEAITIIAAVTLFGTLLLESAHQLVKTTIVFRPKVRRWFLLIMLFSLPLALPFALMAGLPACGVTLIVVYGVSILLAAMYLSRLPVAPTRRNIMRLVLASIPIWIGLLVLSTVWTWLLMGLWEIRISLPKTVMDWISLALQAYMLFAFSLGVTGAVWINYVMLKKRKGIRTFREVLEIPRRKYKRFRRQYSRFRHRFVEEWGFSGLYFDCLLPLLTTYLLTGLASEVDQLRWLAYLSGVLNFCIFTVLNVVFVEYAFSPRPITRIKLDRLRGVLDLKPEFSLQLPLALLITAALFGAYWVNYSVVLANFSIVSPKSFVSPSTQLPADLWEWSYITFRLMMSGEFDMTVRGPYAQMVIMTISMSEFAFLGLFFAQIIRTLKVYGNAKENGKGSRNG
jgi:tetratricopeptide (TPR) repeat protein